MGFFLVFRIKDSFEGLGTFGLRDRFWAGGVVRVWIDLKFEFNFRFIFILDLVFNGFFLIG